MSDEDESARNARYFFSRPEKQEALRKLIKALAEQIAEDILAGRDTADRLPLRLTKPRKSKGPAIQVRYPKAPPEFE